MIIGNLTKMKIGMRTIKTAISVLLTISVAQILNLQSPLLAGIAAVVTMQSNIIKSLRKGKSRLLGTVFGATIGLVYSLILPGNLALVGIGVILVIIVCNLMDWDDSITIALVVFLSVMIAQESGERLSYSINRTIDTLIGVVIAASINLLIFPPNTEKRIISVFKSLLDESNKLLKDPKHQRDTAKLNTLKTKLENIEKDYEILENESKLNICKNQIKCSEIENIINLFESLYNDLYIISELKDSKSEPQSNTEIIEKLDDVYEYHQKRADESIKSLRKKVYKIEKQNSKQIRESKIYQKFIQRKRPCRKNRV